MARPGFRLSFQFSLNGRCSIEMVVARYLTNMIAGFTRLCEQAKTLEAAAASSQPAGWPSSSSLAAAAAKPKKYRRRLFFFVFELLT